VIVAGVALIILARSRMAPATAPSAAATGHHDPEEIPATA
jgi:hypothetical protein